MSGLLIQMGAQKIRSNLASRSLRVLRMRLYFVHSFVLRLLEDYVVNSMSLERTSQEINPRTDRCPSYHPPPS